MLTIMVVIRRGNSSNSDIDSSGNSDNGVTVC